MTLRKRLFDLALALLLSALLALPFAVLLLIETASLMGNYY